VVEFYSSRAPASSKKLSSSINSVRGDKDITNIVLIFLKN